MYDMFNNMYMSIRIMKQGSWLEGRNRPFVYFEMLFSSCKTPIMIEQKNFTHIYSLTMF